MEVKRKIFLVAISAFVATVFAVVDFYATDKRVGKENLANFDIAISATIQDFLDSLDHKE
jgi:hypothetical protein